MKRTTQLIGLVLGAWSTWLFAENISHGADRIINQIDPNINMGIMVVDVTTGENLYSRNGTQAFIPASNMKLFSDAAALLALGPDYRFKSQLSTDATSLEHGTLKGSLFLHLPGDPSLTQQDLQVLLARLVPWGIKRIDGNVVIDSSRSMVNAYGPGWLAEDLNYSYGAPVAPVVLDENRLMVTVNPSYQPGALALVEFKDPSASLQLNNQVKTANKAGGCGVSYTMDNSNQLTVRGCVGVGQWAVQQRMAIRNPLLYTQGFIKQELAHLNIQLAGQVLLGTAPRATLLLGEHASKPISQLMADTLKPSDNLYADSLYLHAAAKLHGTPLNWAQAQPIIKNFLQQQTGIDFQNATLSDGSGLSRSNLITPFQTVSLLHFLYDHFPITYEYIAALPVAGRDGTLQKRLRKPNEQDLIRAKTGTMKGVMSLSGYLYTANSHVLAFAIYINKRPGTPPSISGKYRYLVEALCDYFLRQSPTHRFFSKATPGHSRLAFQQQLTQAEKQRNYHAKWRGLESAVKQAVRGLPVTVLFREHHLVLQDNDPNESNVRNALDKISKKYTFKIAVQGHDALSIRAGQAVFHINEPSPDIHSRRVWTLCESVG